jgi:hypothetical protein
MRQPAELRLLSWRTLRIFLAWSVPVYLLPLLSIAPSQGLAVLRSWPFHLTFLIPAVVVGGIGALVLTNSSPTRSTGGAIRGALIGLVSSMLGAVAGCLVLTSPDTEGRPWFGILEFPIGFFATVTGLLVGTIYSRRK